MLTGPGDLWVDFWIPSSDPRWRPDSRGAAILVGEWWAEALGAAEVAARVHREGLAGDAGHRLVCFAGAGPGEVFLGPRKIVGVTQWRVREGTFLSSIVPSRSAREILSCLSEVPDGLEDVLDHHTTHSLALTSAVVTRLVELSGPWARGLAPHL